MVTTRLARNHGGRSGSTAISGAAAGSLGGQPPVVLCGPMRVGGPVLLPGVRHRPGSPAECLGHLADRPAQGGQVIGRRDQLPDRLSPAAYLDLDPTVPLGLRPHLVDRPVDFYVARPVPHHLTSHVRLCEEYDGPGTVAGHR